MTTLENWLPEVCSEELSSILLSITDSCKIIGRKISKEFSDLQESSESYNKSGDLKTKLDIFCNNLLISNLASLDYVSSIISEESDDIIRNSNSEMKKYLVSFDPLDGSSNISCEGELGTIFGIYKDTGNLPTGNEIICAGYILYSYKNILILTFGEEIYRFCLDTDTSEYKLSKTNLIIPCESKKIFSVNVGNYERWKKNDKDWYHYFVKNNYKIRYSGCMVMDVHRILMDGGIFFYPVDSKNLQGKLRLIYECFPMSFIIETAGGIASSGNGRLLNILPEKIHQKTPIYLGCKRDMMHLKQKNSESLPNREIMVMENFNGSGEDELFIREGEEIKEVRLLEDNRWAFVIKPDGEKGTVPTKCLSL